MPSRNEYTLQKLCIKWNLLFASKCYLLIVVGLGVTRLHFGSGETNMAQWSQLLGDGLAVAARYGSGKRSVVPVPCLSGPVVFLNDWESCHRV